MTQADFIRKMLLPWLRDNREAAKAQGNGFEENEKFYGAHVAAAQNTINYIMMHQEQWDDTGENHD